MDLATDEHVAPRGFTFYSNEQSQKGAELQSHPFAALNFYWPELELQVRVEGPVERVTLEESDAYFATRPRPSQLGAWASKQSEVLPSREELLSRLSELERKFQGQPVPRPPHWGGYRIVPSMVEFWKNMPSRLHLREQFTRKDAESPWESRALYP